MKKIILSALIISMAFAVNAQEIKDRKTERPQRHENHKGQRGHDGMAFKNLNLSEAQKAQMKLQNESFRKQMEELKKNDGITVKDSRTRMETIRKNHKEKMQNILTTDQKAQLEKMKIEGMAKHEAMAKDRSNMMKEKLGLTADQSAKMEKNRTEMSKKMKAIKEDKSISDEQKKEKMKELMKQNKESMQSILTAEQLQKMKEGNRKEGNRKADGERRERMKTK